MILLANLDQRVLTLACSHPSDDGHYLHRQGVLHRLDMVAVYNPTRRLLVYGQ